MPLPATFAALLGLLALLAAGPCRAAETPPNVVLILSDDQAYSDYGFMGHPHIETPHLDKLAGEAALFRRGYVPTALCRPSLMTLLTGRYASTHGVTGNDPSRKYAPAGSDLSNKRRAQLISYVENFETIPQALGKRGYLSHQSGKLWEGSFQHVGFTHGMTRGFPEKGGRHGDDGLKIGRAGMEPIAGFVDHAVAEQKPFFLWYAPFLPHTPHNPPARLFEKYKAKAKGDLPETVARYYAMCEWFDETCGELVGILDDRKVLDNTLIVYVCDNGWIQDPASGKYFARSKQTPYEGGIRTPIFYHWPKKIAAADRTELETSLDIFPTILSFAGAPLPDGLPGLDLKDNLLEGTPIERDTIYGEGFAHDIADIEKPEASLLYRWAIEGKWKLLLTYDGEVHHYQSTHPRTEKRPQLFDLSVDPWEKENLAGDHPEVVARLAGKIQAWYPVKEREVITEF